MLKYYFFFKNSMAEALVYRANVFLMLLAQLISLTVFIFLWQAIYAQNSQVGNYSLNELIIYYALSSFLGFVIQGADVAWWIGDEINLGKITNYILRPVNYFWATFSSVLGKVFFKLGLTLVLMSFLFFYDGSLFLEIFSDGKKWFYFLVGTFLSFCLFFSFFFVIGIFTFWLETVKGVNFFVRMVMFFLAGSIVPLDLLPNFLIKINNFLPFQYIVWWPIQIFQNKIALDFSSFLPILGWIVFFYFLGRFIFKKGIRKYEGFGA